MADAVQGRATAGVRRAVTFTGWCGRCGWEGKPLTIKGDAAFELAAHNVDEHGGSWRDGAAS